MPGHHDGEYAFGQGAVDSPTYMETHHKSEIIMIDRLIGNRAFVFGKNTMIHFYMAGSYFMWTNRMMTEVGENNMLHVRLDAELREGHVMDVLRVCGILFVHFLEYLPIVTKSNEVDASVWDMRRYYRHALHIVKKIQEDPGFWQHQTSIYFYSHPQQSRLGSAG